ncbi:MAG: 16S rRNA (adenine(1518)-N(6)/adenine(1519)-N(6))-dimethyltransferase RsmA [Pseudomonadota bacterium]
MPPLREVIKAHDLRAKRSLGQNFILDLNLTRRIARACPHLDQGTVFEVGPGPGGLTRGLLMEDAANIVAIERDARVLPALATVQAAYPGRLTVQEGDALSTDWVALQRDAPAPYQICANLPYGIATQLLVNWLETDWPPFYRSMVLMFQREVAERIVARPGTKAYGRLAVIAQWSAQVEIVLRLKPEAFTPPPKVSSAVVAFTPYAQRLPACDVKALGRVTAAAFGQRRKMLRSSLKTLTPFPELALDQAGLDGEARAEQVDPAGFARLAAVLG